MMEIAEIVPNFSEGRDERVFDELVSTAQGVPGATLLDASRDADHNRCVLTIVGEVSALEDAAFRLIERASETIDLTSHEGEHPRIGAADVVPFVPLRGTEQERCVEAAHRLGARTWDELGVPVYYYESAALRDDRRDLADVRRGGFEGLAERMMRPEHRPDVGGSPHPTAGAVAIGVRRPLVAFNVMLGTSDVGIAKRIARAIRGSSGGFKACKALGIMLSSKGTAQVSINFVDTDATPIYRVFEAIRVEAARYGVDVVGSELIGLAPSRALVECAAHYLRLNDIDPTRCVIEERLLKLYEHER